MDLFLELYLITLLFRNLRTKISLKINTSISELPFNTSINPS